MMAQDQIKMVQKSQAKEHGIFITFHIGFQYIIRCREGQIYMQNPWVTEDYSLEELETPTLLLYLQREQHGNAVLVKKN